MGFFDLFKKKQNTQPTTPAEQSQPTSPENHRSATVGNTTGNDNKQGNDSPQPTNRTADREQAELNTGLEKTKTGLFSKLARAVAGRSTIDTQVLDDLEEVLITSDVGVETTVKIIERIEARVARDKYMNTSELQSILRDEIAQLMEESHRSTENFGLDVEEGIPYVIMVVGVNGAGKTTTIGKLAAQLTRAGLNVYIGAADTFRAAAIDQLQVWADRAGATMIRQQMGSDPASVAFDTLSSAKANGADVVLIDTAGRLHVDEDMMAEAENIKAAVKPDQILMVVDAMTGQDAVNAATAFDEALGIDGVVLTKLDGDARGGAALSIRAATGKPIKFMGTGEKLDMIEPFHPDRMAQRILGMGDVLSFIERAEQSIDEEKAKKLEEKLKKNRFTLSDYYDQLVQLKSMGSFEQLAGMMPGQLGKQMANAELDPKMMAHTEAIILSMTPYERENPAVLGASRKKRIAAGCGLQVVDVNRLLKQFEMMQQLTKQLSKGGRFPGMPGLGSRMHGFGRKKRLK